MKILLHICCANCALYPIQMLRSRGHEVFGYFYNPNIHPYQEYARRIDAVREIETRLGVKVLYEDRYEVEEFLRKVVFREGDRCRICYHLRLEATARIARRGHFEGFTATLLGSKHQDHHLIEEIGLACGKARKVPFQYFDFREGWAEGIAQSQSLGLYRQQYCGCIYSEKERYLGKKGKNESG